MRIFPAVALLGLLLAPLEAAIASENPLSLTDKVALQATMQRHIDKTLVAGRYLHLDPQTGEVQVLRPLSAHPMILRMGEYFVLCADFRGEGGAAVNVDYYVARKGKSFVVFDKQVENRALVKRLMKAGEVTPAD